MSRWTNHRKVKKELAALLAASSISKDAANTSQNASLQRDVTVAECNNEPAPSTSEIPFNVENFPLENLEAVQLEHFETVARNDVRSSVVADNSDVDLNYYDNNENDLPLNDSLKKSFIGTTHEEGFRPPNNRLSNKHPGNL